MAEKTNYRKLGVKELIKIREEMKGKLREMRFEQVVGSNFNLGEYRKTKRDIARINTILRENEMGIEKPEEEKKK